MKTRRSFSAVGFIAAIALAAFALGGCDTGPAVLSGVVSTAHGPAANVTVDVYDTSGDTLVTSTRTDANGSYTFGTTELSAGSYLVGFGQPAANLWWENAASPSQASPVAVSANDPATVSPVLPSGTVTGVITDASDAPVAGATVEAIDATSTNDAVVVQSTITSATGSFDLNGVPVGSYWIRVRADGAATRYVGNGPTGTAHAPEASVISVAAGVTSAGNDLKATAESTITGSVKADADPLADILVFAVDASSGRVAAATRSAADGTFSVDGLSNVGYQVMFIDPSGNQSTFVWGSTGTDPADGVAVTPAGAGTFSVGDVHLGQDCQPGYAGADLTGAHFAGADFTALGPGWPYQACDFVSTDLTGADLSGADLSNAMLFLTDLTAADLTGANLTGASFASNNLTGADLTGATLDGVESIGITGTPLALPAGWSIAEGYLVGPKADLSGFDLSGVDLSGVDLSQADLTNTRLDGANLDGTDLGQATLDGVVSSGNITGVPAALPAHWQLIDGVLIGPGATVHNADLTGTDLTGCDLSGARFDNSKLIGADLTDCNLSGVKFYSVQLTDAILVGVDLSGANVQAANLSGVSSGGVTHSATTYLPVTWIIVNGYLVGAGADLAGADFDGADLHGATLSRVTSGGITGTPTDLPEGWNLIDGYLFGPSTNLAGVDLSGFDLSGLDIHGANLTGATLIGTNLSGTNMQNCILADIVSGGIIGSPAPRPAQWMVAGGYLVGPTAVLAGADLSGLNLSYVMLMGTDLSGTDLSNTDLSHAHLENTNLEGTALAGADLSAVTSGGITGTPASLPAGWALVNGTLVETSP